MRGPPERQKDDQQPPVEMTHIAQLTTFKAPATALGILKGGFHPHAQPIKTHQTRRSRQIRNQEPGFVVLRIPAGSQLAGKAMGFPQEHLAIPGRACLEQEIAAALPVAIAATKAPTTILIILNAQHIMPVMALTEPDEWQGCQAAIRQEDDLLRLQELGSLCKETLHDRPLPLVPLLALGHDFPRQRQEPFLH